MSYENFKTFVDDAITPVENRRKAYLRNSSITFLACLVIFFTSFFYIPAISDGLNKVNQIISESIIHITNFFYGFVNSIFDTKLSADSNIKDQSEVIKYQLYILLLLIWLFSTTYYVFGYRRNVKTEDLEGLSLSNKKYSLKEAVFSSIFKYFGEFSLQREGGIRLSNIRNNGFLPKHSKSITEDRISGVHNDVKIEFSEVCLLNKIKRSEKAVFSGLIVEIDISSPDLKLNKEFRGETFIVTKERFDNKSFKEKLEQHNLKEVKLDGITLDYHVILTNAEEEAKEFITADFIEKISNLKEIIDKSEDQVKHIDDRIMNSVARFSAFCAEAILNLIIALITLPRALISLFQGCGVGFNWRSISKDNNKDNDIYFPKEKDKQIYDCANFGVEASLRKDKIYISVPYDKDLFEPNSIFEKPVIESDLALIHGVMNQLFDIAERSVKRDEPEENTVDLDIDD